MNEQDLANKIREQSAAIEGLENALAEARAELANNRATHARALEEKEQAVSAHAKLLGKFEQLDRAHGKLQQELAQERAARQSDQVVHETERKGFLKRLAPIKQFFDSIPTEG